MTKTKSASRLVDEYIDTAQDFARPICKKLREIIFKTDPELMEEWKWGPTYSKNGSVCSFNHFKSHVILSFFQGAMLADEKKILAQGKDNLSNREITLKGLQEIDEKTIIAYLQEAIANNAKGIKANTGVSPVKVPLDFRKALKSNRLQEKFFALDYVCRKEYVQWIENARKEDTRSERIKKGIEKISKGLKINQQE